MGLGAFCWQFLGSEIAEEDQQPIVARSDVTVTVETTAPDSWILKT
jgi:hypothetical protein